MEQEDSPVPIIGLYINPDTPNQLRYRGQDDRVIVIDEGNIHDYIPEFTEWLRINNKFIDLIFGHVARSNIQNLVTEAKIDQSILDNRSDSDESLEFGEYEFGAGPGSPDSGSPEFGPESGAPHTFGVATEFKPIPFRNPLADTGFTIEGADILYRGIAVTPENINNIFTEFAVFVNIVSENSDLITTEAKRTFDQLYEKWKEMFGTDMGLDGQVTDTPPVDEGDPYESDATSGAEEISGIITAAEKEKQKRESTEGHDRLTGGQKARRGLHREKRGYTGGRKRRSSKRKSSKRRRSSKRRISSKRRRR